MNQAIFRFLLFKEREGDKAENLHYTFSLNKI